MHIKKNDTVVLLSGSYEDKWVVKKDKDGNEAKRERKTGKVLEVSPEEGKVIVSGMNLVKKHVKPRKQGDQGGILSVEGPMYACKVALYCATCGKGVRAKIQVAEDGTKTRVCAKCGAKL